MPRLSRALAPVAVIAVGLLGTVALVRSKAPVETERPAVVLPLVRVMTVGYARVPLTVTAQGTVLPRTETTLAAQVAAVVVAVSPHFEVGGFFERGEALVRLDRRDYELEAERAAARVAQAELRLSQQQAEARVAAEEWGELGDGEPDPLVLRQPQMAEARAMLKAAEAELGMARLAVERTVIRAPFDGRVRGKEVDLGQYLTPGQAVATVHAIDYAEVRLPVPDRQLAYLNLPLSWGNGVGTGPTAELSANFTGRRETWSGEVVRTEGELDRRSRMLHLVVRVEDPYGRWQPGRPPLAVGLFVDAEIKGRTVVGALVPRSALRGEGRVLVVDDEERLRFRDVDIVRVQDEAVVIGGGLEEGERVCVSPLEVVIDGMQVRTLEVEGLLAAGGPAAVDPVAGDLVAGDLVEEAEPPASGDPAAGDPAAGPPVATGRLLAVSLLSDGDATVLAVSVDGELTWATSRLDAPERFVIDLVGVVKANPRSSVDIAAGPVERVRVAQYQAEPEPVTRLVFDLRGEGSPLVERSDEGLLVSF